MKRSFQNGSKSRDRLRQQRRLGMQALERRHLMAADPTFTNLGNPMDVNGDNEISPMDALGVINILSRLQSGAEGEMTEFKGLKPDTNGDSRVTASDALGVVNALAREGEEVAAPAPDLQIDSVSIEGGQLIVDFSNNSDIPVNETQTDPGPDDEVALRISYFQTDGTPIANGVIDRFQSIEIPIGDPPVVLRGIELGPMDSAEEIETEIIDTLPDGEYYAIVSLDPNDKVNELDESNNEERIDFTIGEVGSVPLVTLTSDVSSATEGSSFTLTLTRNGDVSLPLRIGYTIGGSVTTDDFLSVEPSDFELSGGEFEFAADQTSMEWTIAVADDGVNDPDELLSVMLAGSDDYRLNTNEISVLIAEGETPEPPRDEGGPIVRRFDVDTGGTTVVRFAGENVHALVDVLDNGSVRLVGAGLEQTISVGTPNVLKFQIDGHNNTLVLRGIQTRDDLIFDVDGNQNRFALLDSSIGDDLIYRGAEGVDKLVLRNTRVADKFDFRGRKVRDEVAVIDSVIGGDFVFHGDDGDDALFGQNVQIGDDAIIRMGDGNDVGAFDNVAVRDVADLDGQSGQDAFAAGDGPLTARRQDIDGFDLQADFATAQNRAESVIDHILGSVGLS